ncbi:twisted gastrulation protein homolog 1-like [Hemicordylus capensis]|uniref:twisted gastrulation protein homolog 1-like n=1 Tax=Hemicordylus capensis TaxID=884348 RepID=UPI002303E62A|nr:twisted gastrulation protein homolog 1-like [Hemicordylus capensis]XP_053122603.1 twisted gastrulation protein homolog 1-like [Hemicordylus capensis]XP_053122604.1 twisted gastrulation protein homolog 1-like [Hemicordylus capensis]
MPCGVALLLVAATWTVASSADGCNKALCASDVSKCLLQEVCQCEANRAGCPCCQECAFCLGNLWESCCECVGLCDERPPSAPRPALRSSMHNLMSPVPSLFRALMAISDNDPPMGWSILTLSAEEELRQNHADTGHLLLGPHTDLAAPDAEALNATAPPCQSIFFNECLSMSRCRMACQSVGAWRYRWFHNACCQCLGPDCQGYGGARAQCSSCRE